MLLLQCHGKYWFTYYENHIEPSIDINFKYHIKLKFVWTCNLKHNTQDYNSIMLHNMLTRPLLEGIYINMSANSNVATENLNTHLAHFLCKTSMSFGCWSGEIILGSHTMCMKSFGSIHVENEDLTSWGNSHLSTIPVFHGCKSIYISATNNNLFQRLYHRNGLLVKPATCKR